MGEFASRIREQAAEAMRQVFRQEATPGMDPLIELIGFFLEDETGSNLSSDNSSLTTEQSLNWNQLAMDCQEELAEIMTSILDFERLRFPTEPEAMRRWAIGLVFCTLDRMRMT